MLPWASQNGAIAEKLPLFFFIPAIGLSILGWIKAVAAGQLGKLQSFVVPFLLPTVMLMSYGAISLVWFPDALWGTLWLSILVVNGIVFALILVAMDTTRSFRLLFWTLVIFGTVYDLFLIYSYSCEPSSWLWNISESLSITAHISGGIARSDLVGTETQPSLIVPFHQQATVLNCLMAMTVGLLLVESGRGRRAFLYVSLFVTICNVIVNDVRGAFIGLLGMIGFLLFAVEKFRKHRMIYGLMCVAGILAIIIFVHGAISLAREAMSQPRILMGMRVPSPLEGREVSERDTPSLDPTIPGPRARAELWSASAHRISESLFLGVGPHGTRIRDGDEWLYPHSIYLAVVEDYGVVGCIFGVLIVISMTKLLVRVTRSRDSEAKRLCVCAWACWIGLVIHGITYWTYDDPFVWCVLGLTAANSGRVIRGRDQPHNCRRWV